MSDLGPCDRFEQFDSIESLPGWMRELSWKFSKSKGYYLEAHAKNVEIILQNDPRWAGVIGLDEFAGRIVKRRLCPWGSMAGSDRGSDGWSDVDDSRLECWMIAAYGIVLADSKLGHVVSVVASSNAYHPVREYLASLQWDGVARADEFLTSVYGVDDTPLHRAFGAKFLIGAVARIMEPGCKVDTVLVLEGDQGIRKSSSLSVLAGDDHFVEIGGDLDNKDTLQSLWGKWIGELSELSSFKKTENEQIKKFFSAKYDDFRPSYGRHVVRSLRSTIFVGTTNLDGYLSDPSGGRRYWPVFCRFANLEKLREIRDQLWAEAMHRYVAGESWWLSEDQEESARVVQAERYDTDIWEPVIAGFLTRHAMTVPADDEVVVTIRQVFRACSLGQFEPTRAESGRVGNCLRRVGAKSANRRIGGVQTKCVVVCREDLARYCEFGVASKYESIKGSRVAGMGSKVAEGYQEKPNDSAHDTFDTYDTSILSEGGNRVYDLYNPNRNAETLSSRVATVAAASDDDLLATWLAGNTVTAGR